MDIKQVTAFHSYVNGIFTILKRDRLREERKPPAGVKACTVGLILAVLYCPNIKYYIYPHMFTYTMHVELMFLVIFKTF